MNSIEQRLIDARENLKQAQAYLSYLRLEGRETAFHRALFYRALDRLWEAQCMAEPRL
jgi:hypothetical protein